MDCSNSKAAAANLEKKPKNPNSRRRTTVKEKNGLKNPESAMDSKAIFSERLKSLGLHDDKFYSKLIAQERVRMFAEKASRNRKLIAIDSKSLLTGCQKFRFSPDGKLVAAGNKDGNRIFIMELITDSKGSLQELVLICICYRGFFSSHLKSITFSPDNNFVLVTSDTAKMHVFHIGTFLNAKNNLRTVRKNEIKSCMVISLD